MLSQTMLLFVGRVSLLSELPSEQRTFWVVEELIDGFGRLVR
jgi:hypothetical protein